MPFLLFTEQHKLVSANGGEAGKVAAGVAESNDSLLLGLWLTRGCLPRKPEIITNPYGVVRFQGFFCPEGATRCTDGGVPLYRKFCSCFCAFTFSLHRSLVVKFLQKYSAKTGM